MPLLKRILVEKRALIVPLLLGVLANVAAYGLWVYPLGVKSAGAADRAAAAAQLAAVRRARTRRRARARRRQVARRPGAGDLLRQSAAGRSAVGARPHLRDAAGAGEEEQRQAGGSTLRGRQAEKNARLGVLKVHTAWQGDYESFRQFIYALESASPFVIIDDVALTQSDPAKPLLTLTMELSTYFRLVTMATERRRQLVLAALAVILAAGDREDVAGDVRVARPDV